ncbi:MAG: hypothetical protein AAF393_11785 [Pseudomonadota bacterium]
MADNQTVSGTENEDVIVTGDGKDNVSAGGGDDWVETGAGDDYALGGAGKDVLIGDTAETQEFAPKSLNIIEDHNMSMTFDYEQSSAKNTIGTYKVDPDTGAITDVQIVWDNASSAGSGGELVAGQSAQDVSVAAGEQVGFFMVADGFSVNDFANLSDGTFQFVASDGGAGNVHANTPPTLEFVSSDGEVAALNGAIYHATATGIGAAINTDGTEASKGISYGEGTVQLAFDTPASEGVTFSIDVGANNYASILNDHGVEDQVESGDDRLEGRTGEDEIIGHGGDDLLVGGGASTEWELVDGKWVYHADRISNADDPYMVADGSDDVISGGSGDDVLIGNAGNDALYAGSGDDRINAGVGDDTAFGGIGSDKINLEDGDDYAEGGLGADTINAGDGDDVVYGDDKLENILKPGTDGAQSFANFSQSDAWEGHSNPDSGLPEMSQSVETEAGQTYTFSIDLAANLPAGVTQGAVEVLWNGQVIQTLTTTSGTFESHQISIDGTGEPGQLSLRNVSLEEEIDTGPQINTDDPIFNYSKSVEIGGEEVDVAAFAPGQAKLYQVISGQLKVFDPATNEYVDAGADAAVKVNAIGFNVQDDLIYGIAKSNGVDALGNPISTKDLVMMDAHGEVYRVGETPVGDYVGDFDDSGNLWTFQASVNRITKIDVDNLDADGNPIAQSYYLPKDFLKGNTYDIAYNAEEQSFYALVPPGKNGGDGMLHKIDVSNFDGSGTPEISSMPVTGTLFDGTMHDGMPKGAYGAIFMDGEGNLYAGLNKGDHDLDGSTGSTGAIYQINYDFEEGTAYAEFMSKSQSTGSNDGAVDPRAVDPFAEVDQTATVQIKNLELVPAEGGDDHLRGGAGDDEMHGNAGDDVLHGGTGDDLLYGDEGADKIFGGEGNDEMFGGLGNDHMEGGDGDDAMYGGDGADFMKGGAGNETLDGGGGDDKLYGGSGDDVLNGGEGADKIYGGEGADTAYGDVGNDTIDLGAGDDFGYGGAGKDFMQGKGGNDFLDGGAGNDKIVGGSGEDIITGGAGDDHLWGGQWWKDGASDTFTYSHGGGKDTIHDFEVGEDRIDLSAYGMSFEDLQDRIIDRGWATEINLEGIDKSGAGDKIMLKSIDPDNLDESNFIL